MRKVRDLSQREFADRLTSQGFAVDPSAVSRIENGTRAVRIGEAVVIADVLNVELDFLISGNSTPERQLRGMRRWADTQMNLAEEAVVTLLETLQEIKMLLENHPSLLRRLDDPEYGTPGSADEYYEWVSERFDHLKATGVRQHAVARSEEEAVALNRLARAFVDGFASTAPLEDDDDDDGDEEGIGEIVRHVHLNGE